MTTKLALLQCWKQEGIYNQYYPENQVIIMPALFPVVAPEVVVTGGIEGCCFSCLALELSLPNPFEARC